MNTVAPEEAAWLSDTFDRMVENVGQVLIGKRHVIELAFTTLIAEGHLLLEDVPGTGKTSLARALAQTVGGTSNRIQFTPDMLPGDVTGITVYDQKTREFEFHAGPVFANIVLADEINRASPKTQSALLEVMEEQQVTVDGVTRPVGDPFMVVATQNPIEQAGTYRLPEAQLDRFLIKTTLGYPDDGATMRILQESGIVRPPLEAIIEPQWVIRMADIAAHIFADPVILDYITRIVEATRNAQQVRLGASVRGAIGLTKAAKTWAGTHGRNYVTPDDVKTLAEVVLAHRLILEPESEFEGVTAEAVVNQIVLEIEPPDAGVTV